MMDQRTPGTTATPNTNVIRNFLSSVVPWPSDDEEGFITIHWKFPGREGFRGKPCRNVEEALAQVVRLQDKGCDIYFGLFRTALNDGTRDRANAIVTGSLFADADVDPDNPKAFASFPEALASIFAFCIELKIPKPSLIVLSGGGFHVYWLSDKTLPVEDWQPFADALMHAIRSAGTQGQGCWRHRRRRQGAAGAGHDQLEVGRASTAGTSAGPILARRAARFCERVRATAEDSARRSSGSQATELQASWAGAGSLQAS